MKTSKHIAIDLGAGSADIEAANCDAHAKLFIALISHLVKAPWSYSVDTHPSVWVTAFHQVERKRFILSLLNYQKQLPCVPIRDVPIKIEVVNGHRFTGLIHLPEEIRRHLRYNETVL